MQIYPVYIIICMAVVFTTIYFNVVLFTAYYLQRRPVYNEIFGT